MVAASIAGSTLRPRLKWVAGAIGTGLAVAAISDTCLLGMALAEMPRNRSAAGIDVNAVLRALSKDTRARLERPLVHDADDYRPGAAGCGRT